MISSSPLRNRSFKYLLLLAFTLCFLFPFEILLTVSFPSFFEADASERQMAGPKTSLTQEPLSEEASEEPASETYNSESSISTLSGDRGGGVSQEQVISTVIFQVDDFVGSSHSKYSILVPPARAGLSPQLSLNYSSSSRNGWLGVGFDLSIGFIQRNGPRKGVPKYDDAKDVFELNLGGTLQVLVYFQDGAGYREYRLKIEGACLRIRYYSYGNYWEVWDKTGVKMRFGSSVDSRIGKIRNPGAGTETYRWCLDRVEDPKGNYIEILYWKDENDQMTKTYQIYLNEIRYNGQSGSPGLAPNHKIFFIRENRNDFIYNYRAGFEILTRKRLSWIEVKTKDSQQNDVLVRKYQIQYVPAGTKSLVSSITHHGKEGLPLPSTNFYYKTHSPGFQGAIGWHYPGGGLLYWNPPVPANHIQNIGWYDDTWSDVIDLNGDGLPDRVVASSYYNWTVYPNKRNEDKFGQAINWPAPDGSGWISRKGGLYYYDTTQRLIDMNGDGLPDLVVSSQPSTTWTVYINNGAGFNPGVAWPYPGGGRLWWGGLYADHIETFDGHGAWSGVVDMNGDGLPDRVVTSSPTTWTVFLNNGSGFGPEMIWPLPDVTTGYISYSDYLGISQSLIDMNGDGLPDRVVSSTSPPYNWTVYFNNGAGFNQGVAWPYPGGGLRYWNNDPADHIQNIGRWGTWSDVIDMNGDGLPDRVVASSYPNWTVYLNNGTGFTQAVTWPDPRGSGWISINDLVEGVFQRLIDIDGDGLLDQVVSNWGTYATIWSVYRNNGPNPDLLWKIENGLGGTIEITYRPSTEYDNTGGDGKSDLPFVVQTVDSYTWKDGRGNSYLYLYDYSGGLFDPIEREFRGFKNVTSYQMADAQNYESKTESWFHQDYFKKGKVYTQILTSREGHTRRVDNLWENIPTSGGGNFPSLKETTSTITDQIAGVPYSYSHRASYIYDGYLNVRRESKYGMVPDETIHTFFYYNIFIDRWILSRPKEIEVKDKDFWRVSRKWMSYDSNTGNLLREEICKSDNPRTGCPGPNSVQNSVITYQYYSDGNLWKITDPGGYTTTLTYDSTKTHVYETINALGHKTTTEYDPETGNLKKLIPPHLEGTTYAINYDYDAFGRKTLETRPDGGWTSYQYVNFGNPNSQYVEKREHIVGGPIFDHYTLNLFDGMGRTYRVESTGPDGKRIVTDTLFDIIGRVWKRSNPYFFGIDTPYHTTYTYDGLSRVVDILTPDNYHITTDYQGLKKVVTNQRGYSTAYTYDVYQRLKKVEDANGTATEYTYDALGNLIQVIAAKGMPEQNTTIMTYDSLSKKRTMTDPDMGYWTYQYDKSGNLISQTDAKNQTITFQYDGLNRLTQKVYPDRTVTYTYDDPGVLYSRGKLTRVSDPSGGETKEDSVLEYDLMQRVRRSRKTIGADSATFERTYDSAGRIVSITYLSGTPNQKVYRYEYDVAGNLLYVKDSASENRLVEYSEFTSLGQPKVATFPKPSNVSVKTTYTYDPSTARLKTLLTQKLVNGIPTETYQNLNYQQFDGKGNIITIADNLNAITHGYTYDTLDRLLTAHGTGTNPYSQSYQYDRIGNITYKLDVGNYAYNYGDKPHAVTSAGLYRFTYDANGNMTQKRRVRSWLTTTIQWNYDNKPTSITNGIATTTLTYDGNGQRVKKVSPSQNVLYFGELYEKRNGTGIIHVFAGNKRVVSVLSDGKNQFYHPNHLGSASVITDQNGNRKEQIEYFPFGTERAVGSPQGTYDFDAAFPDVFYTFTDQEVDDELGLYNFKARLYDPLLGGFISPDSIVPDPADPQALNRYAYCRNNPLLYKDPSGRAFTPFHMIAEFAGASLGYLFSFGSSLNPFQAAWNNYALDVTGLNKLDKETMALHATKWQDATVGEALSAAWKSFTDNLNTGNTWMANHTFYDILTHWGIEWKGFKINDPSTWVGGAAHLVFNDIILGALFFPVALIESVVTNVWDAFSQWFSSDANNTTIVSTMTNITFPATTVGSIGGIDGWGSYYSDYDYSYDYSYEGIW